MLFWERAMNEVETLPAPVLPPPSPPSKWEKEYRAFLRLLPQLLQKQRGQYVAIHNGQVVDSDDDEIALALRVIAKVGPVPVHIDRVVERPPIPERITHRNEIVL